MGVTERLARASSRHPRRVFAAWGAAIVVALALAALLLPGNLTTNGHVTGTPQSKRAEDLFATRFPPDKNGVDELIVVRSPTLSVDDPTFKTFVAGEGDEVCADTGILTVNGRPLAGGGRVLTQDSAGRALPRFEGCGALPEGWVFVASAHEKSFDSRTFGPVRLEDVRGRVTPLWTY